MSHNFSTDKMILASFFSGFTIVGAFLSIPMLPVPMSLQSLFVLLSGMVLGSRVGALSQFIYILIGLTGLPVFAGSRGGIGIILGPTGGFLLGFVFGSYTVGRCIEKISKATVVTYFLSGLLGALIIYLFGIIQFCLVTGIELNRGIYLVVTPFLLGDLVKIFIATFIAIRLKKVALIT